MPINSQSSITAKQRGNVAAIIVSYNDAKAASICVRALRMQVRIIILVDNGSSADHILHLSALETYDNLVLLKSPTNLGIGAAINLALAYLDDSQVDWVLTMDQDSIVAPDMVDKMLEVASNYSMAAFTPQISDIGQNTKCEVVEEVSYAITSGNLIPLCALRSLNGFNEDLFIDGVDFDLSLRLREAGYRIFRVTDAYMGHTLGNFVKGKRHRYFYTDHSPLRRYYMARNMLINSRRHFFRFPLFIARLLLISCLTLVQVIIWGPKRLKSLSMILVGIMDGIRNKSGLYSRN